MKKLIVAICFVFMCTPALAADTALNGFTNITESNLTANDEFVVWNAAAVKNITAENLWDWFVIHSAGTEVWGSGETAATATWTWNTGSGTDASLTISDTAFTFNKAIECTSISTTRSATVGGSVIIGYEGSNSGDSYVALKAPDSRDTTLTMLYPTADPSVGQVMTWSAPSTGVSTGTWATPALSNHTHTYTESFVVKSPVDTDDFLLMKAPASLTITALNCVAQVTTSGSITAAIQECDGDGANCADGGISLTADGSNDSDTSFTDASIDSGDWLKVFLGDPTGTVNFLSCTLSYTR